MEEQKKIAQEYQEFATLAEGLTAQEMALYKELPRSEYAHKYSERYNAHILRMQQLFSLKYGPRYGQTQALTKPVQRNGAKLMALILIIAVLCLGIGYALCLASGGYMPF